MEDIVKQKLTDKTAIKGACKDLDVHEAAADTIISYMPKVAEYIMSKYSGQTATPAAPATTK